MSTWLLASTGTLVSWLTGIASSFTPSRFAYSLASIHAGPLHASPLPVVFSTSHGALASTPTRSTPAFLIASTRGLVPGAGSATSASAGAAGLEDHAERPRQVREARNEARLDARARRLEQCADLLGALRRHGGAADQRPLRRRTAPVGDADRQLRHVVVARPVAVEDRDR